MASALLLSIDCIGGNNRLIPRQSGFINAQNTKYDRKMVNLTGAPWLTAAWEHRRAVVSVVLSATARVWTNSLQAAVGEGET